MVVLEREPQLAALQEYAAEAAAGSGRLVLIAGEAGVGKSTVVEELERRLPGLAWLAGACDGMFTPRTLGPLHDIAGTAGGELASLCASEAPREQLFGGLLRHLRQPGAGTVLVIEDVHWADEATLDLILFLGRRLRDVPVLLIVTYRDEALAPADPLPVALGELVTQRGVRRIDLPPLSRQAVARLGEDGSWDPDELHRLTGGNPFFLTEVLHAPPGVVPASARDAVLARTADLDDAAVRLLHSAALLGTRASPEDLATCADALLTELDPLVARSILVEDAGQLRFRHELACLAVAGSIPMRQRAALHRRILDLLLARDTADDVRLAHHADGCRDSEVVLRHAPRAAAHASLMGSHREAVAHLRLALAHHAHGSAEEHAALLDRLADELSLLDDYAGADAALEEAITLHAAAGDVVRRADSLRRRSRALSSLSRGAEARAAAEEAVWLLEPRGDSRELAWAHAGLAGLHMIASAFEQALPAACRAQELAARLDLDDVMSDALNTESCVLAASGEPWREAMDRALQLALDLPHPPLAARAYNNLYTFLTLDHRPSEAEQVFQTAMTHARDHDIATYHRCMRGDRALGLLGLGRWDEGLQQARQLVQEPGTSTQNWLIPKLVIGLVAARRGEDGAWRSLSEALEVAEMLDQPQYLVPILVARAEAAWLEDDLPRAGCELARAAAVAPAAYLSLTQLVQLWARRTGVGGGDVPATCRVPAAALEIAGDATGAAQLWDAACCSYDAALALLGSHEEEHLQEAVVRLDALGATATARHARRRLRALGLRVPAPARTSTRAHPRGLTTREQEVLAQLAAGMTNEQIARRLVIATRTVDHHVAAVLAKLGVANRREACAEAERLGLLGAEDGQSPARI